MKRILAIIVWVAAIGFAQESGLNFSGLLQTDLIALHRIDTSAAARFDGGGISLFTLNALARPSKYTKIDAGFDLNVYEGAYADYYQAAAAQLSPAVAAGISPVSLDIRRLYGELFLPFGDLSIGRQIINFGQGSVFSPIDVFSSADLLDLSFKRKGSDVVRLRVPFKELSGADIVAKISSRSQGATAAAKIYGNIGGTDVAVVAMYRGDKSEVLTGITFKGDLEVGIHGELVEHWPASGGHYFIGMAGTDYSIDNIWFFNAEYLFAEKPMPASGGAPIGPMLYDFPYVTHHYGFGSIQFAINDLTRISLASLADLQAGAGFSTLECSYDLVQNATATLYARYFSKGMKQILSAQSPDLLYGLRAVISF